MDVSPRTTTRCSFNQKPILRTFDGSSVFIPVLSPCLISSSSYKRFSNPLDSIYQSLSIQTHSRINAITTMKISAALTILAMLTQDVLGNLDIVTLFAKPDAYIQEASATLVVGNVPQPITGDVALWSAIMMENQASFLQGVTENAPPGYGQISP